MTKWLLTPSNNHQLDDDRKLDFRSTEWLLERHPYTSTGRHVVVVFITIVDC